MSRNLKLLIALIVFGTIAAYVLLVMIPTQMAKRSYEGARTLGEDFRKAFRFTPEVKVHNTIVLNQQVSEFQLSVLSQNFEHRYVWEHSFLGSTKKIFINGTFSAMVGFDLHQKFSVTLRDDEAVIVLPPPETLSVESMGDISYRDEHGIWNWVSTENRTHATNAFITDARRYANDAPFVQDGKAEMERRLKAVLAPYAKKVTVHYQTAIDKR